MNEIERCRKEQIRCRDYILRGESVDPFNRDLFGAWQGLQDWLLEEIFICEAMEQNKGLDGSESED